jgi:hypothetical protein
LRWVTTNIARFDPSVDWPTDLDCTFQWNRALRTYDGEQQRQHASRSDGSPAATTSKPAAAPGATQQLIVFSITTCESAALYYLHLLGSPRPADACAYMNHPTHDCHAGFSQHLELLLCCAVLCYP